MSNPLKDLLNKMLTPEQKAELKAHVEKFNVAAPVVVPVVQEPVKMGGETKLVDGTVVKYDTPTLAVGSVVTIVTPDGELPAPDGSHNLEDGTMIEVAGGKVTGIELPEVETPEAPQMPSMPTAPTPVQNAINPQFESEVKESFNAVKAENESLKAELAKLSSDIETIKAFFNTLVEIPTATPVEAQENKFASKVNSKANALFNLKK